MILVQDYIFNLPFKKNHCLKEFNSIMLIYSLLEILFGNPWLIGRRVKVGRSQGNA